jgi:hypothetical protein
MPKRSSKKPRLPDPVEAAFEAIQRIAGEAPAEPVEEVTGKTPAAVELGRRGGLKGGKARAEKLSPAKRRAIAKKAAWARWGKKQA